MQIRIEHRLGDNYDLGVPVPTSDYPVNQHGIRIKTYRIARQSLDTFLSRLYTHTLRECVRQDHLYASLLYWYADIEIAVSRKRNYSLCLAVCAPPGYLTRRLHYLYRNSAIERSESGLWVAYTDTLNVVTSESVFDLLQSLT